MDPDLSALFYTVLIDFFVLLFLHVVYVFVSDIPPQTTNRLLAHTDRIRDRTRDLLDQLWNRTKRRQSTPLVISTHHPADNGPREEIQPTVIVEPTEEELQIQAHQAVADVVITPRIKRLSVIPFTHSRKSSSTTLPTVSTQRSTAAESDLSPISLTNEFKELSPDLPRSSADEDVSALDAELSASMHGSAIFDSDDDFTMIESSRKIADEIKLESIREGPEEEEKNEHPPSHRRSHHSSVSFPSIQASLRQALGTLQPMVQHITSDPQPTINAAPIVESKDDLEAQHLAAELSRLPTKPASSHVGITVIPTQEDVKLSAQTLVTPPNTLLRIMLLQPLFDLIFPPIRVFGIHAMDALVYFKFTQLLIFLVAMMTVLGLSTLLTVNETQNSVSDASSFTAASIVSVPSGSRYYLAHFIIAYLLFCLFCGYIRILISLGTQSLELSTAITDDCESVAAARTLHLTHLPLNISEEALRQEIMMMLPDQLQEFVPEDDVHNILPNSSLQSLHSEIYSVHLYYDVSVLEKLWKKRIQLINQMERLEILALQIKSNPRAKVKLIWLKMLKGTKSVGKRLEELEKKKKDLLTKLIDEIFAYYERVLQQGQPIHPALPESKPIADPIQVNGINHSDDSNPFEPSPPATDPNAIEPSINNSGSSSSSSNDDLKVEDKPSEVELTTITTASILSHQHSIQQPRSRASFTGQAFIAFRSATSAVEVVNHAASNPFAYRMNFAPKPSDFLWENLSAQRVQIVGAYRWFLSNSSLLALVLFVGIPTLILHEVTTVVKETSDDLYSDDESAERVFLRISNYLTTLIMWVINWKYIPYMIKKSLDFEKHMTTSDYQTSRFYKSSLFLFAIMTVLPIFASNTVSDLLGHIVVTTGKNSSTSWYQILGNTFFVNSGIYFAQYLTHDILMNVGLSLMTLPMYIKRIWRLRTALTAADYEKAYELPKTELSYDRLVATFGLILLNCITLPILLPFGLVYFIAQYNIDLFKLRRFQLAPAFNKGILVFKSIRCLLLYLGGWCLLMAALFFVQAIEASEYYLFGVFFTCMGFGTLAVYRWKTLDTSIPIASRMKSARYLDEKITAFANEQTHSSKSSAPSPGATSTPSTNSLPSTHGSQEYLHLHLHRPPTFQPPDYVLHPHISSIAPAICPDCTYRHPIWKQFELDDELVQSMNSRLLYLHQEALMADSLRTEADGEFVIYRHKFSFAGYNQSQPSTPKSTPTITIPSSSSITPLERPID